MFGPRSSPGVRVGALAPPAEALVDEALATYMDWRDDERGVADAYARWCEAPGAEESLRFGAYAAALDQEQAAARDYAESIDALARWLWRHGAPAADHQHGMTRPHPNPTERSERPQSQPLPGSNSQ
jgi:hypothetical protein